MRNINYERLLAEGQDAAEKEQIYRLCMIFGRAAEAAELGAITCDEQGLIYRVICPMIAKLVLPIEKEDL